MRILPILLSMLALGCTHTEIKTESSAPREPAAQADAEAVSRAPLAISTERGKALVMTVVKDRELLFETCALDATGLSSNADVMRVLNSGSIECVNLNPVTFDVSNVPAVDAIFRQFALEQKFIVEAEVAKGKLAPFVLPFVLGLAAFNTTGISYNLLRGNFDRYYGQGLRAKVLARGLGVVTASIDVVLLGLTGAGAAYARNNWNSKEPTTVELALQRYVEAKKTAPGQVPVTSGQFFDILVTAMTRATKTIDYKLRSL